MFELAAFFHSHKADGRSKLVIKHVALAPFVCFMVMQTSILMIMEISLPTSDLFILLRAVYVCGVTVLFSHFLLKFWHDVAVAEQQFRRFSWHAVTCACCAANHRAANGTRIPCDRAILEKCVVQWFGSVEALEACVRNEICDAFVAQVSGGFPFGYFWLLVGNFGVWYGHADFFAARMHGGAHGYAASLLVTTVAWWLWVVPTNHLIFSRVARWMQRKQQEKLSAPVLCAVKCTGYFANILNSGIAFLYQSWCYAVLLDPVLGGIAFAGTALLCAALSYRRLAARDEFSTTNVGS